MSYKLSHAQGELLAQVRPLVGSVAEVFKAMELRTEITLITAVVTGSTSRAIELHQDVGGSVYDNTNAILRAEMTDATDGIVFQAQHPGSGIHLAPGDTLGLAVPADTVTVSIYGITETLADRVRPGVN